MYLLYYNKQRLINNLKIIITIMIILFLAGCSGEIKKQRQEVTTLALQQVGIKYKYGGTSREEGFDCSGLVYYVYNSLGYKVPRTSKEQYKTGSRVIFFRKPADLLFFNTQKKWWKFWAWRRVNHVGIYIGDNKMVHAPTTGGKVNVVNNVFKNEYWSYRYLSTRRIIK